MKIIKRILLGLLGLILLLILILVVSVAVDGLGSAARLAAVTNTTLPGANGGPEVRAYVARPQGNGPFPTVIMIHEFFGLNESIVGKVEGLAAEGYLVIAPDTFRGSTTSFIPRAIYQVISTPEEAIDQDLDTVYAWLENQSDVDANRVGIAGFCYGGRASLLYALHNPRLAATVVFYGSPETDPAVLQSISGPVLGIFGGADASIPLADVEAFDQGLSAAGVPHQVSVYDGQPHAFVTSIEGVRQGGAQAQAWQEMLDFLAANLKSGSGERPTGSPNATTASFPWRYYAMLVYEHAFGSAAHGH